MAQEKIDNVTRFLEAFASGDKELLASLVDPEFENLQSNALPYGGTYRGWEGFTEFALGLWPKAWNFEKFEMLRRFDEKLTEPGMESVVMQFHLVGSVPATGERIDTTLLEHWILRDGKLLYAKPHWFEPPSKG